MLSLIVGCFTVHPAMALPEHPERGMHAGRNPDLDGLSDVGNLA